MADGDADLAITAVNHAAGRGVVTAAELRAFLAGEGRGRGELLFARSDADAVFGNRPGPVSGISQLAMSLLSWRQSAE